MGQANAAAGTDRINYVNIGLMVVSCVVALYIPFELFLFAYAVLGPPSAVERFLQRYPYNGSPEYAPREAMSTRGAGTAGQRQSPRSFLRPSEMEAKAARAPEKKQEHLPFSVDYRAVCRPRR